MNNRRKYKVALAILILFCLSFITSYEVSALTKQIYITVKVNGNCINMDEWPYLKDDRTFVSVRFVAEALGAEVKWVDEKKMVVIKDDYNYIELFVDSNKCYINAEEQLMDTSPEISDGRTMVPLRFISENLGCSVEWDEMTYSVLINKENAEVPAASIFNRPYTDEDVIWLSRIVSVEARGLSIDAKVAVANVVLNRVKSTQYPNSVYDVIFDTNYCVQFPPAHKEGFREIIPPGESVIAAKMALEGINNVETCMYFNYKPFPSRSKYFYKRIDGEYFYN